MPNLSTLPQKLGEKIHSEFFFEKRSLVWYTKYLLYKKGLEKVKGTS